MDTYTFIIVPFANTGRSENIGNCVRVIQYFRKNDFILLVEPKILWVLGMPLILQSCLEQVSPVKNCCTGIVDIKIVLFVCLG